eukprot:2370448-Rhodomonas_salina.1
MRSQPSRLLCMSRKQRYVCMYATSAMHASNAIYAEKMSGDLAGPRQLTRVHLSSAVHVA